MKTFLLLLGFAVFVFIQDLVTPPWEGLSDEDLEAIRDGKFWGNIIVIALFSVPSIWWHISDLWSPKGDKIRLVSIVLDYRTFLTVLIIGLAGSALVFSGVTEKFYCRDAGPSPDGQFFTLCDPPIAYGIEFLTFLPALVLIVLATFKTIAVTAGKIVSSK